MQSLVAQVSTDVEGSLWNAIRSVEESVLLLDHVGKHLNETPGKARLGRRLLQHAREAEKRAGTLRQLVLQYDRINLEDFEGTSAKATESTKDSGQ
jgi:two-component system chemotaxis response regulator CheB